MSLRSTLDPSPYGRKRPVHIRRTCPLALEPLESRTTLAATPWVELQKLTASEFSAGDVFGDSVAISGGTIVVGADRDDSRSGSAYVLQDTSGTGD